MLLLSSPISITWYELGLVCTLATNIVFSSIVPYSPESCLRVSWLQLASAVRIWAARGLPSPRGLSSLQPVWFTPARTKEPTLDSSGKLKFGNSEKGSSTVLCREFVDYSQMFPTTSKSHQDNSNSGCKVQIKSRPVNCSTISDTAHQIIKHR